MKGAEDRILEAGLATVLDDRRSLADAVVERWHAGDVAEEGSRARPWHVAVAVAAVLLLAVVYWLGSRGDGADGAFDGVARLEQSIAVADPGVWPPFHTADVASGQTIVAGPERERTVSLAGGGRAVLGRCSLMTVEREPGGLRVVPRFGRITLDAAEGDGFAVTTAAGEITVAPGTRVVVDMTSPGYGLEHPERFPEFAQEVHMRTHVVLVSTLILVLEGTCTLTGPWGVRELAAGERHEANPVQDGGAKVEAALMREVGTWSLVVSDFPPEGEPRTHAGTEVCRRGPGGKWLISDMTMRRGDREITSHTVLGYLAKPGTYTGTFVDNFGGRMGILEGKPNEDLSGRTVEMTLHGVKVDFRARMTTKWTGKDTRETVFEVMREKEWVKARKVVHTRVSRKK